MSNEYSRDLIDINKGKRRLNICFILNYLDSNDERKLPPPLPHSSTDIDLNNINPSLPEHSKVDDSVSKVNTNVDSSTPTTDTTTN